MARNKFSCAKFDFHRINRLPNKLRVSCATTLMSLASHLAITVAAEPPPQTPIADSLPEIIVEAPEPRYVAPTRRDRIGRIWAPVMINDKGPFRLVLDTGANHSAVSAQVAETLGIALPTTDSVVLNGATGFRTVSSIRVNSVVVGDLDLRDRNLPIVSDALGGAEGILGTEGLLDKRIYIDFRNDYISIQHSHNERAPPGFVTIKFRIIDALLVVTDAKVGGVPVRMIIDTGGQSTIANEALRRALRRRLPREDVDTSEIVGATLDIQRADVMSIPNMIFGNIKTGPAQIVVADLYIFERWHMTQTPTIMLGMDVLGLFDTLIIDYGSHQLQIRVR
jgi:predicted aspartyl protease